MSRYWFVALLLAFVPACAKPTTEAPQPPAVVLAPDPVEAMVYDGIAPPPREVPLAAQPYGGPDTFDITVVGAANGVWKVQYPDGQRVALGTESGGPIVVPGDRPVKITVSSEGAPVWFEVPAFAVRVETAKGKLTHAAIKPTRTGTFGVWNGRDRIGEVVVVTEREFNDWLMGIGSRYGAEGPVVGSLADRGRTLFAKMQCARCHESGPNAKGPTLEGLYGTKVALKGGGAEVADDLYIIQSIRKPKLRVVEGWEPIMPAYDMETVSAEELNALVAYIRSLKPGDLNRKEERFPAPVGAPTERPKEPPPPPK